MKSYKFFLGLCPQSPITTYSPSQRPALPLVQEAAKFAHERQLVFPSVSKVYSKLKIVKNCLRPTMKDEFLNDLVILACEKDSTYTIKLKNVVQRGSR